MRKFILFTLAFAAMLSVGVSESDAFFLFGRRRTVNNITVVNQAQPVLVQQSFVPSSTVVLGTNRLLVADTSLSVQEQLLLETRFRSQRFGLNRGGQRLQGARIQNNRNGARAPSRGFGRRK